MYCGDDVSSAVLDLGSHQVRGGYSGEDAPRIVIPSAIGLRAQKERASVLVPEPAGSPENQESKTKRKDQKFVLGQTELGLRRDNMDVSTLMDDMGVINFEYLDEFIENILSYHLHCSYKDTPLLFTDSIVHNKEQRLKLTEHIFEKYETPALFLVKDPVLCTFSCGRFTAVNFDCGNRCSIATSVHEGYALYKTVVRHPIGGKALTHELWNFIQTKQTGETPILRPRYTFKKEVMNVDGERKFQIKDLSKTDAIVSRTHPNYKQWSVLDMVRQIKEDFLSIAEEQLQPRMVDNSVIGEYDLPDGSVLKMSQFERQAIGEKLFASFSYPDVASQTGATQFLGAHHAVLESIQKSDLDIRKDLYANVILSGGTTMMKGFPERLAKQLVQISPNNMRVKVLPSSNNRKFSSWIGGSILSALGSFQQMWMSRQEYQEHGALMIERKCP